tara:strand:+ start:19140 stop:19604 length:465 start_codon:yes stop_codon:yes gene_type:complete
MGQGIKMARVNVNKDLKWGLGKEQLVMRAVAQELTGWDEFKKLDKYDSFDYCANKDGTNCFVEIKSRRIKYGDYEETIVPASKIAKGLEIIGKGNKVYVVISFTDGIYYLNLANATVKFGYNARTDRGALELNHYAFIPLAQFKRVSKTLYTED